MSTSTRLKAQSAFEFMFIFGVFLSALILGIWISQTKTAEVVTTQRLMEIDDFLSDITAKVDTAWLEGEGFSSNVTLPAKIAGFNYTITHSSNYIYIKVLGVDYGKPLVTANLTGTFVPGTVQRLRNTGETIEII